MELQHLGALFLLSMILEIIKEPMKSDHWIRMYAHNQISAHWHYPCHWSNSFISLEVFGKLLALLFRLSDWPLKPSSQSCAVPSPKLRRLQRANGGLAGEARRRELPLQLMRRRRPLAVGCRCGSRTTIMFRPFRDMAWAFGDVSGIWSCWDLPSTSPWVRQASQADSWNAERGGVL